MNGCCVIFIIVTKPLYVNNIYLKGGNHMLETNQDIRQATKKAGLKLWQIADRLNLNDGNFSRKLRKELTSDQKQTIFAIINELVKGVK